MYTNIIAIGDIGEVAVVGETEMCLMLPACLRLFLPQMLEPLLCVSK
jgi:hypothetical protein